jgi:prophage regulatory protein
MSSIFDNAILRLPEVLKVTGVTRSSLYEQMAAGLFPASVLTGMRSVGWPYKEVEAMQQAKLAGMSKAELTSIVEQMHANRKIAKKSLLVAMSEPD